MMDGTFSLAIIPEVHTLLRVKGSRNTTQGQKNLYPMGSYGGTRDLATASPW